MTALGPQLPLPAFPLAAAPAGKTASAPAAAKGSFAAVWDCLVAELTAGEAGLSEPAPAEAAAAAASEIGGRARDEWRRIGSGQDPRPREAA